jgi:hypothetical protein
MSQGKKAPVDELRDLAVQFKQSNVSVGGGRYLYETLNGIADDFESAGRGIHTHEFAVVETVRSTQQEPGGLINWIRIDRYYCKRCLEQQEQRLVEQGESRPEWW